MEQDFRFRGILQLSRHHIEDIIDVHELNMDSRDGFRGMERLNRLLNNRKIRFINPWGKFEYTKFGHFYFDENDVMMFITREREYTLYHRPSILDHTLWSTVPVIFAGIDTRVVDDCGQPIFTGDIVTIEDTTSVVRYFHPTIPGLAGDNCELQFRPGLRMHKEGTAFRDISVDQFKHFDEYFFLWPTNQYLPNGLRQEEVISKAHEAMVNPIFATPIKPLKSVRTIYSSLDEVLREDRVLVYFTTPAHFDDDDDDVDNGYIILSDNYPDNFDGEIYEIGIGDKKSSLTNMLPGINSFLLHAHQHPETKFVLCDFVEILNISDYQKNKIAMLFHDWFTYNLTNVILPGWILIKIASYECIGRD